MNTAFKDYFSGNSEAYSQFRPKYPAELFSYLASISNHQQKAWDCATGNGQSAVALSDYFSEVIATDASKTQIENAVHKNGIRYRVATAENSHIESNSIDLIAVAQAFHWFDTNAFSKEAERVLKQGGIIAIWTYNLLSIQSNIDEIIYHFYQSTLGEFWAFERKMVEDGYRDVQLPFIEIDAPQFHMSAQWNLSQLIGYLCTWSAVKKFQQELGINPVEQIHSELHKAWGQPDQLLTIKWPLGIRVWQKK